MTIYLSTVKQRDNVFGSVRVIFHSFKFLIVHSPIAFMLSYRKLNFHVELLKAEHSSTGHVNKLDP